MKISHIAKTLAAYAAAAYLTIVLVLAAYGVAAPRPGDRVELARAGFHGPTVLTGMRNVTELTPAGLRLETSRYYAVLPDSFAHRAFWIVTLEGDGGYRVEASHVAFWTVLALVVASLVGTWWFWLRSPMPRAHRDAGPDRTPR